MDEFGSEEFGFEKLSSTSGFDFAPAADVEDFSPAALEADPFGMPSAGDDAPASDTFFASEALPEPVAPASDTFYLPEPTVVWDKEAAFNEAWENRLKEAAAQEAAAKQTLKEEAEEFLDVYHDQRTDSKQAKMETNRKQEDELSAEKDRALEEARKDDVSQWRRAYDLIDTVATSAGSDSERMLKLLLSLKIKGLK
jgi:hypothetical protein